MNHVEVGNMVSPSAPTPPASAKSGGIEGETGEYPDTPTPIMVRVTVGGMPVYYGEGQVTIKEERIGRGRDVHVLSAQYPIIMWGVWADGTLVWRGYDRPTVECVRE